VIAIKSIIVRLPFLQGFVQNNLNKSVSELPEVCNSIIRHEQTGKNKEM
jgi:hypothetical protein